MKIIRTEYGPEDAGSTANAVRHTHILAVCKEDDVTLKIGLRGCVGGNMGLAHHHAAEMLAQAYGLQRGDRYHHAVVSDGKVVSSTIKHLGD